jgi:hypothetical protein
MRAKLLLQRLPLRPRTQEQVRHLLVTPQIDALLDGHVLLGLFPDVAAEKLIGIYSAGQLLTVSRAVTKRKPDVEQVVGHNEVWALCARTPRPGWRILGRWYDERIFIALRAWDKNHLFRNYGPAAQEVIGDWHELFGTRAPHSATAIEGYVGGVYNDVDDEEKRS